MDKLFCLCISNGHGIQGGGDGDKPAWCHPRPPGYGWEAVPGTHIPTGDGGDGSEGGDDGDGGEGDSVKDHLAVSLQQMVLMIVIVVITTYGEVMLTYGSEKYWNEWTKLYNMENENISASNEFVSSEKGAST